MAGYRPLYIKAFETALVQSRQEFILPEDAYPTLQNAYVWRERIKRKQGGKWLGRLQRNVTVGANSGRQNGNLLSGFETTTGQIAPGTLNITDSSGTIWTDPNSDGVLVANIVTPNAFINYSTGVITQNGVGGPSFSLNSASSYGYFPGLPVMSIRPWDSTSATQDTIIFFDTTYAYIFSNGAFQEWIPGTTWNGQTTNYQWTTNYWTFTNPRDGITNKVFWASPFNDSDPLRFTQGTAWFNFLPPTYGQIDNAMPAPNYVYDARCFLPFRGRMVMFNTYEGPTGGIGNATKYSNRIRWAAIGSPFTSMAWRSDIQGQGGFLNIPTNEDIVSVGFVRDNLVVYCENSTWQLRYTGRSIAPFQIEKVNSEFGTYATFSSIQFDTSLLGVGDKGIIQCDSYKSERIDIKIPDLVYQFAQAPLGNGLNQVQQIQGVRDFVLRLAYWIYPGNSTNPFPTNRLVYNYENDSWAIFEDNLSALGTFQPLSAAQWNNFPNTSWEEANFSWQDRPIDEISIVGGTPQGYVLLLNEQTINDTQIQIKNIVGNGTTPVVFTSPIHNLYNGQIIYVTGILPSDPYYGINDIAYQVNVIDNNTFSLLSYNLPVDAFDLPVIDYTGTYLGGAQIQILDNFNIVSKKFNYADLGQKYQLGYVDVLIDADSSVDNAMMTLNIYSNYNDDVATNQQPGQIYDPFFNTDIPLSVQEDAVDGGSKNWNRVTCVTQSNFITLQYTFSNFQMQNDSVLSDVQIDAQVIWSRPAGRMLFVQ
jgi:hypothetical protein